MIGGAYKVITPIGKGGMGDVYRARHVVLQKDFAVKVLTGQELNNVNWLRFQTEAKVISKLDHKNVEQSGFDIHGWLFLSRTASAVFRIRSTALCASLKSTSIFSFRRTTCVKWAHSTWFTSMV